MRETDFYMPVILLFIITHKFCVILKKVKDGQRAAGEVPLLQFKRITSGIATRRGVEEVDF